MPPKAAAAPAGGKKTTAKKKGERKVNFASILYYSRGADVHNLETTPSTSCTVI